MMKQDILSDWRTRPCILATMHGKEVVIAPQLEAELGIDCIVPKNFNTDQFGTFTRDITRVGNQLEAARAKAAAALKHSGFDLAIASEGSFGNHPTMPIAQSNLEIIVLIDKKNDLEIIGHSRNSSAVVRGQVVHTPQEAVALAVSWNFPTQGVIVRKSKQTNRHLEKEIRTIEELERVATNQLSHWFTTSIYLETDMRAHRCPSRMQVIAEATGDLINNCNSLCPSCATPGFVVAEILKGLPCSACKIPTDQPATLISACQKCRHSQQQNAGASMTTDPSNCGRCNP